MNDDNWKPALNSGIRLQVLEGEAVLLDRANERVHQLDSVGTQMLQLCDGQRSVSEIVALLLERYEVDERQLRHDTSTFLKRLRSLNILV